MGRAGSEAMWMPFYVADYLKDTQHLSTIEHGAYTQLIMRAWISGGLLPLDEKRLAVIVGMTQREWRSARSVLLEFFTRTDEGYRHKRVDRELAKTDAKIEQRKAAGKASAEVRWGHGKGNERVTSVTTGSQREPQRKHTQSQSQVPLEHNGSNGRGEPDADQVFWEGAKAFVKPEAKGDPGALIGKWCREHGKEATAQAITKAQLERPAQRVPFIVGCLKQTARQPVVPL